MFALSLEPPENTDECCCPAACHHKLLRALLVSAHRSSGQMKRATLKVHSVQQKHQTGRKDKEGTTLTGELRTEFMVPSRESFFQLLTIRSAIHSTISTILIMSFHLISSILILIRSLSFPLAICHENWRPSTRPGRGTKLGRCHQSSRSPTLRSPADQ